MTHTSSLAKLVQPNLVQRSLILFFVAFLLIFPKGGVKVGGIPLTWGYLGLAGLLTLLPLMLLAKEGTRVRTVRLLVLFFLLPFQLVVWGSFLVHGIEGIGFATSVVVTFFAVPLALVWVAGVWLDRLDLALLFEGVRLGVFAVAVYGLFLFGYKLFTGDFIEVPLLTVNLGDLGELEEKNIDRGGIFKLISTYNNGNIFGICLLMLLPLYAWLEKSTWKLGVVKLSLLFTLSRTVWAGLIAYELIQRLYVRRASLKSVATLITYLALMVGGVWWALSLMDQDIGFVFDAALGGRMQQFEQEFTFLPAQPFEHIAEIVYLSMLANFGVVGLVSFLVGMSGPLILYWIGALPFRGSAYKRGLVAGLVVYLIVALSDGAILFIPVMAFYWFLVSLLLSDNPQFARIDPPAEEESVQTPEPTLLQLIAAKS